MLRRSLPVLCMRRVAGALLTRRARSATSNPQTETSLTVIPPCYWSTLTSGLRVITEQCDSPLACVTLIAEAGSRYETECNNGISHFFEHMACRGLRSLRGSAFERFVQAIGAHFTIHTDREYQAFICKCVNEDVETIIALYARMFLELECNTTDIQKALCDVKSQLLELEHDSKQLCFDYLHQTAFQGTAMSRAPIGPSTNYHHFGKCFLEAYIAQHYQPTRLILSVSSQYCHNDVKCWAHNSFSDLKPSSNEIICWPCRYTGSMLRFRDDSMPFCHIAVAVETYGYCSEDHIPQLMLKHVLGRWDESQCQGYNTWPLLAHASSISKLCYRYDTFYLPYRDVGLWGVYLVVRKEDDIEDAILMVQELFMNACTTLLTTDVDRAAQALKLELANSVEGCVGRCMDMGLQLLYFGCRQDLACLYRQVDEVKTKALRELATAIIYDRCPAVSAIGPTEGVPDYNRFRAGMRWLRF